MRLVKLSFKRQGLFDKDLFTLCLEALICLAPFKPSMYFKRFHPHKQLTIDKKIDKNVTFGKSGGILEHLALKNMFETCRRLMNTPASEA